MTFTQKVRVELRIVPGFCNASTTQIGTEKCPILKKLVATVDPPEWVEEHFGFAYVAVGRVRVGPDFLEGFDGQPFICLVQPCDPMIQLGGVW